MHNQQLPSLTAAIYDKNGHFSIAINATLCVTYLGPHFILLDTECMKHTLQDMKIVMDDSFGMIICVNRVARSRFFLIKHDSIEITTDGRPQFHYPPKVKIIEQEEKEQEEEERQRQIEHRLIFEYWRSKTSHKHKNETDNIAIHQIE